MSQQIQSTGCGSTISSGAGTTNSSSAASAVQGFDPEKCRSLYVGNIAAQITEALLYEIFGALGHVENVKIIKDKMSGASLGYGFVDYYDHESAQRALIQLNGRLIYGSEIRVNWAFAGGHREDTSNHHHVFVGDLSPEIDDKALKEAFAVFGSVGDARVMWDQVTGRSRGYGFVAFREKEVAEQAIREMNGVWLGTRAIRVNWANQKSAPKTSGKVSELDYDTVLMQASPMNTTVYIGGLGPDTSENDLSLIFSEYGYVEEIRVQHDKGYAFVRYTTHDSAARAIVECHGMTLSNRIIRCSWGKERPLSPPPAPTGAVGQPMFAPYVAAGASIPNPTGTSPAGVAAPPVHPNVAPPPPYSPYGIPQYNIMPLPPYNVMPIYNQSYGPNSAFGPPPPPQGHPLPNYLPPHYGYAPPPQQNGVGGGGGGY